MADEEKTEKKTEKAQQPVAPNELVALYERLNEREWNKETNAYKNPVNVMRTVLHLGRVAASRLVDAFARLTGIEGKISSMETRIEALEAFKKEAEEGQAEAMKLFEAMGSPPIPVPVVPPPETKGPEKDATTEKEKPIETAVVPIKQPKKKPEQGQGGAA